MSPDPESVRALRFLKAIFYFLIGSAMLLWMLFHRSASGAELQKKGVQTEGRVVKMEKLSDGTGRISYYFLIDGRRVAADFRSVPDLDGLTHLGPVTIWYDPADPGRCTTPNEIRGESLWKKIVPPVVFGVMISLAAVQVYAILWKGR